MERKRTARDQQFFDTTQRVIDGVSEVVGDYIKQGVSPASAYYALCKVAATVGMTVHRMAKEGSPELAADQVEKMQTLADLMMAEVKKGEALTPEECDALRGMKGAEMVH